MLVFSLIFATVAAVAHVFFFVLEAVRWTDTKTATTFGLNTPMEIEATRPLALNQGFYNLALAASAILGVILVIVGVKEVGTAIVMTSTSVMFVAGLVLRVSMPRMAKASYIQMIPPAGALIFATLALLV